MCVLRGVGSIRKENMKLKFIDLFAGLGGFHIALKKLGHECVYASEIRESLKDLYKENYGIEPEGDIKKANIYKIPRHDILCGGFPCQPFSKAGKKLGRKDNTIGNLFDDIIKIMAYHKPEFFILENVPFIASQDNESMWTHMQDEFKRIKYHTSHMNYSPHEFGIPQNRERIYIVGCRSGLDHFEWVEPKNEKTDIRMILDKHPEDSKKIGKGELKALGLWQEFISQIPKDVQIPRFPIWGMEFGATYPYEGKYPAIMTSEELGQYRGNFGVKLEGMTKEEQLRNLPSYARVDKPFPHWKKRYIRENRSFYLTNKKHLWRVVRKIGRLRSQSWQKLEWNVGDDERVIENYIIQFRASGIRLKKTETSPSLVCTSTQIPMIPWEKRYLTKTEGARLQSMEGIKLPENHTSCFRALGNAVNVEIILQIANKLITTEVSGIVELKPVRNKQNNIKKIRFK